DILYLVGNIKGAIFMKNKKFNVITLIILDNHIYAINKEQISTNSKIIYFEKSRFFSDYK
ncbi:hypothetical protein KWU20_16385, partial [Clostridioides difficile]|nr:hypothetical protein [Clostridioides difficile]